MNKLVACCILATLSVMGGCNKSPETAGSESKPATSSAGGDRLKLGFIVKQPEEPWFQLEWKFAEEAGARTLKQ